MAIDDDEPIWLTRSQIVLMNVRSLNPTEAHGIIDEDRLLGAMNRPIALWQYEGVTDVFVLGARVTAAIAKGHAFEQGNKRTGFQCGLAFMMTNGMAVEPLNEVGIAQLVEAIVKGDPSAEPALAIAYQACSISLLG